MTQENKNILFALLQQHKDLNIAKQIDYEKFYLYSIITHSTAIEGSTVTEEETQLLFDEGITSGKRTMLEQLMNLDLKNAYEYGRQWIDKHEPITTKWLISLASKVMAHTGSEYHSMGGNFDSSKGELRQLNVSAGFGGKSYLSYLKVPQQLAVFCQKLNQLRTQVNSTDVAAIYEMSFWAHFELVTIHPWADGNGRTSRLLMNLLQMEYNVLPVKVLKEEKAEYIQALISSREKNDVNIFINYMTRLHCQHLQIDIDQYQTSLNEKMVDKQTLIKNLIEKWSIKPSLANKLADIILFASDKQTIKTEMLVSAFGYSETSAKRYLRQLTEYGYLEMQGGNKNRTYILTKK